jgi:hypothetical protein
MVDHIGSVWAFVGLGLGTEALAIASLYTLFRTRGRVGPMRRQPRRPALAK